MLESQRRLAALGLFRRVRITELPRTGSLTRDVLVDLRSRDHDDRLRRRPRSRRASAARADDGSGATDELDIGPRGFFSDQPPQPVGQEPIGDAVRPRHAAPPRSRRSDDPDPTDTAATASTTIAGCSRSASRAPSTPPATRSSPPSSSRAGDQLHLQPQGRDRRLRAPHRRLHGDRPLHLRLHQAVRRADRRGGSAADRSPVPAGQAVEVLRRACCAIRATTCSIRSAARCSASTDRWPRKVLRLGSRLREDVHAGFIYRRLPGRGVVHRGRRAARRRGRLRAGGAAAARDRRRRRRRTADPRARRCAPRRSRP